jgi:hypothetical protein
MDAIIMPSTISLANKLQRDFPALTFLAGDEFRWSPHDNIIFYDQSSDDCASLLHEVAHATLGHTGYTKDIELIEMERDAWERAATQLATAYTTNIEDELIQDSLDTYRDWLHARSTCPHCKATGIQTQRDQYKCLACTTKWRVNEARMCALRRYTL